MKPEKQFLIRKKKKKNSMSKDTMCVVFHRYCGQRVKTVSPKTDILKHCNVKC